jgi:uncharacterized repeat protein (TIGR01451 family)
MEAIRVSFSAFDPLHQRIESGCVSRATSSTQRASDVLDVLISTPFSGVARSVGRILKKCFRYPFRIALRDKRAIIPAMPALSGSKALCEVISSAHNRCELNTFQRFVPRLHTHSETAAPRARHKVTLRRCKKLRMFALAALCVMQAAANAQEAQRLDTELIAEVRVDLSSATMQKLLRYEPATKVSQGEVVYYTVRIRNPGLEYVRDVTVTQRVPVNTAYVAESASGPGAEVLFSIDGGQTFARPEQLALVDASGLKRPATPQMYTHIQWRLRNALAPGAVALARFQAVFQ